MLERPSISDYSIIYVPHRCYGAGMISDNVWSAVNQQERLDPYIAGFVDGEGSFHVAIQRNPSTWLKWQLVPEFRVSQNASRRQVLDLIRERFGCGYIRSNHRDSADSSLVLVIRKRDHLHDVVIPFFEANPLLSSKHDDFLVFADIVRAMKAGDHRNSVGFERLRQLAITMNGGGRYRRSHRPDADPESSEAICQTQGSIR
jgi:hypothetical protein